MPPNAHNDVRRPLLPFYDESLLGYLARYAAEKLIDRMIDLTESVGGEHANRQTIATKRSDEVARLAPLLGVDETLLTDRAYPPVCGGVSDHSFFGTPVHRQDLELGVKRFSPSSLGASPHHRALWQLRPFPFCSESWELLVDRCPRCQTRQNWHHTIGMLHCHSCLRDLRLCETSQVPEHRRPSLSAAIGLLHMSPDRKAASLALLPPELAGAGTPAVYELLVRLLPVVEPSIPVSRALVTSGVEPGVLIAAMSDAWDMMVDWPYSFERFCGSKLASRTLSGGDGNGGRTLTFLRMAFAPQSARSALPIIAAMYDRFNLKGPLKADIEASGMNYRATAKALGLRIETLTPLRRRNVFQVRMAIAGKRVLANFDRAEIEVLAQACNARISVPSAASRLGISSNGVEQLAAMRLLRPIEHPYVAAHYKEKQLHRASLDSLEERLVSGVSADWSADHTSLPVAMKAIGGRLKPWGPIIEALLAGGIKYSMSTDVSRPTLHRVGIDAVDVQQLRELEFNKADYDFAFSSLMSRADAEEVLHLTPRASTALFSSPEEVEHLVDGAVPVCRIEEIASRYVTPVELSHRTGKTARAIRLMLSANLTPSLAGFDRSQAELLLKDALIGGG